MALKQLLKSKKDLPHIKVVMLTSFIEDKEVYRALDAGSTQNF